MPALILVVPLIAVYFDQIYVPPQHRAPAAIVRPIQSMDLPPKTEMIYLVSW
jgi:hypothetical protein